MYIQMITNIIKIGNSQGVRLPKKMLEALGIVLNHPTEVVKHPEGILLKPIREKARAGWDDQFKAQAISRETVAEFSNTWDHTEWTW